MFGRNRAQDNQGESQNDQNRVSDTFKVGLCVLGMSVVLPVAQRASGVDPWEGVSTFKDVENKFGGAVRCSLGILHVEAELSSANFQELVRDGKEHSVAAALVTLITELKNHFGPGYLEYPLAPGEDMSPERKLYAAALNMHDALEAKDGEQIQLAKARLEAAILLHKD
jgi:hypothetical protein